MSCDYTKLNTLCNGFEQSNRNSNQGDAEGDKTLCLSRHETDKVLEALPELVKAKQRKLKKLTEEYRLQRATLGQ